MFGSSTGLATLCLTHHESYTWKWLTSTSATRHLHHNSSLANVHAVQQLLQPLALLREIVCLFI